MNTPHTDFPLIDPSDYGLMVQTERPLHEPSFSYVEVYYGSGKGKIGEEIKRWWRKEGRDPLWEGKNHRQRAEKEIKRIIEDWIYR